jgi:hypothetical protein
VSRIWHYSDTWPRLTVATNVTTTPLDNIESQTQRKQLTAEKAVSLIPAMKTTIFTSYSPQYSEVVRWIHSRFSRATTLAAISGLGRYTLLNHLADLLQCHSYYDKICISS